MHVSVREQESVAVREEESVVKREHESVANCCRRKRSRFFVQDPSFVGQHRFRV